MNHWCKYILSLPEYEIEDQTGNRKQESSYCQNSIHYTERYCDGHCILSGNAIIRNSICYWRRRRNGRELQKQRKVKLWIMNAAQWERERMYSCWLTWPYLAPCNPWVVVENRVWLGYSSHYGHLSELSINSWEKIALLFWIIVTVLWRMNLSLQECIGELKRNQSLVSHPCQMPPHCPSVKHM